MYQGIGQWTPGFIPESQSAGTWWEEPVSILTDAVELRLEYELGEPLPSTSPYTHPYEIPYAGQLPQVEPSAPGADPAPAPANGLDSLGVAALFAGAGAVMLLLSTRR